MDYLTRLLLDRDSGGDQPSVLGAYMSAWDPLTYANTVSVGAVNYTDLPVLLPALQAVGPVLLLSTPAGPVVLGRLYQVGT